MTAGNDALRRAYLKLEWAAGRNAEMGRLFQVMQDEADASTAFSLYFEWQRRPPELVIATFVLDREMPTEMSLLAGDLIHNTRTALDHALTRLKERFGGTPGQGVFPICQRMTSG